MGLSQACGSPPFIGFNDEGKCQILLIEGTLIPEAGGKRKVAQKQAVL